MCPESWYLFNGHCYLSSPDKVTYDVARSVCQENNVNAELASIHTEVENRVLAHQQTREKAYIGLRNFGSGDWQWVDGTLTNLTEWGEGQPGEEECAVIHQEGDWSSAACDVKAGFHCKLTASAYLSCPLGWEIFNGACYLAQDELLSWEDARAGCVNKGGDLVSVADEGEQGEVLALIHSGPECPHDFQLVGGLCYLYVEQSLSWADAETHCKDSDAHLAKITNKGKNDQVAGMIQGTGAWLGLSDSKSEGSWKYAQGGGDLGNYNNWLAGSPDGGEEENCAMMFGPGSEDSGKWDDANCTLQMPFVCTKNKGSTKVNRWIGLSDRGSLNSFHWSDAAPVTYTKWGPGNPNNNAGQGDVCVYMDSGDGGWLHTFCHDVMGSVCKTSQEVSSVPPDQYGCTGDQVAYRGSCYEINFQYKSWYEASAECGVKGAHLVSITSEYEQAKITSIIAETGVHFSLGLRWDYALDSFQWDSGEDWTYSHWAAGEPDMAWHHGNSTEGWCAYMHRHDDIGYWRVVSCDDKFSYICESPRQGYTEPPTTTTTSPPELYCPHDYTHKYKDHCYEYFAPNEQEYKIGWDFAEGRDFCQTNFNGDLVSIGDGDEEDSIHLQYYIPVDTYWIGMREEGEEGYHWVDGTQSGYTNWGEGYPNSQDGREQCVTTFVDGVNVNTWANADCATRLGIICETEAQPQPFTTTTTTRAPSIPCNEGDQFWYQMPGNDQYCYAFSFGDTETGLGVSWSAARSKCNHYGGELASIHSIEENNFIKSQLEENLLGHGWIGLNRLTTEGSHEWSDTSAVDFVNWADGEPNDSMNQESCVLTVDHVGNWNDESCGNLHSYVCKKPKDGSFTTKETTPYPAGHCPQDWLEFQGRCYKTYGLTDEGRLSWSEARAACKNNSITRMHNGELASIHSGLQQAFIVAAVAQQELQSDWDTAWIGLSSILVYNDFKWTDETEMDFSNWNNDEPNGYGLEPCVEMFAGGDMAGKWNDIDCNVTRGYICEIRADPQYSQHHPDFPDCAEQSMSGKGFYQFRDSCYNAMEEEKTFSEAEENCRQFGENVHLLSVMDMIGEI